MEILKIETAGADTATPPATPDAPAAAVPIPAVVAGEGPEAAERFLTFFTDTIRNPNTRAAYYRNARRFFHWCEGRRLGAPADQELPRLRLH